MRVTILAFCIVATAAFAPSPITHHSKTILQESMAAPNISQNFGNPVGARQGGAITPPQFRSGIWPVKDQWDPTKSVLIHGETLRTSSLPIEINNIHMMLKSDGRPIVAKYELWMGPDYTPWELKCYSEDGIVRPVNALIATPKRENTIAIRNIANMEFPFEACMKVDNSISEIRKAVVDIGTTQLIQGKAIRSYPLPEAVESVQVFIETDGRHLKAKVELLQGPNNVKQAFEVYASDGHYRPFHVVIDTPGAGNMIRIINQYTMEYPILATILPLAAKDKRTGDITFL